MDVNCSLSLFQAVHSWVTESLPKTEPETRTWCLYLRDDPKKLECVTEDNETEKEEKE